MLFLRETHSRVYTRKTILVSLSSSMTKIYPRPPLKTMFVSFALTLCLHLIEPNDVLTRSVLLGRSRSESLHTKRPGTFTSTEPSEGHLSYG
jgi:hypothetical protein